MKLELSEIARTIGMKSTQEVDEPCPEDLGLRCTSPITGSIRLTNTVTLLLVEGDVKAEVVLECGRCLVDFTLPIEAHIEEEFRLENVGDAIQVLPVEEEDQTADLVSNNFLDLQELIRQSLLLVLPIQPLCRPDCRGLCPTCGKNLNVRKCICPPAEPESPFKVLAELLEEENEHDE